MAFVSSGRRRSLAAVLLMSGSFQGFAAPPPPAPGAATTPADPFHDLLAEIGYKETEGGRPTREQIERVRALAAERGITLPERGRRRRAAAATPNAETVRTLYLQVAQKEGLRAQPVEVRLGISDGLNTEVLGGLEEKALVIASVVDAEAKAAPASAGASNPFAPGGGQRQRRF
jgi:HlyD family secretion protein